MTNEEKAKEIGKQWYFDTMNPNEAAYRASIQMAEWKEQQMIRNAKDALCKLCPYGPCPYPVDKGEECRKRVEFEEAMNKI